MSKQFLIYNYMSYIDDTGDPETGQSLEDELKPWPGYPDLQSFRIGMTPAICNNWFAVADHMDGITCQRDYDRRSFRQTWTTSYAPRDAPWDIPTLTMRPSINPNDRPWDIDTSDTARQENGTWVWEILHQYNTSNQKQERYMYDNSHRITLDNWSENNAVAGAFLSHPDHLTRVNFLDLQTPGVFLNNTEEKPMMSFRRGDFIMRVQGMTDQLGLYKTSNADDVGPSKLNIGITLATSNPTAKAQDFSTGGFKHPVLTMADNPFWRADPSEWPGIIKNLKMDVLPYYAPTRKTRPVMYRFWEGEHSTALYGGPVFHCHTTGLRKGDLSVANVPCYRKFLRDFMASDDTIMRWRDSIGLPKNEDARYPHNYANYWRTVQALNGVCNINGKTPGRTTN